MNNQLIGNPLVFRLLVPGTSEVSIDIELGHQAQSAARQIMGLQVHDSSAFRDIFVYLAFRLTLDARTWSIHDVSVGMNAFRGTSLCFRSRSFVRTVRIDTFRRHGVTQFG